MPPSSKGGPVTKAGKSKSSRNAISHGLTAKKWIDPAEQESYQLYLSALNEDFHPPRPNNHLVVIRLGWVQHLTC